MSDNREKTMICPGGQSSASIALHKHVFTGKISDEPRPSPLDLSSSNWRHSVNRPVGLGFDQWSAEVVVECDGDRGKDVIRTTDMDKPLDRFGFHS